ncbi:MAG: PepSY domain-containing protein [Gemmatimonas sp.]|nr:PepSY domain-containing protein [Gemmatimonas sp.]
MKLSLTPDLVKRSLAAHGWLGLLVGALMYIVCLTGTLSVFYPEFERWEQPGAPESLTYDVGAMGRALNDLLSRESLLTEHVYLNLPTEEIPRASVSNEERGWFVEADGSLGDPVVHDWTHFLIDTHLYLTLPETFGIVLVSALGALLVGLIVSGLFAHPRLFKDAFHLRLRGGGRLEQVDIHNRLSVWGFPFHLLIAVTGAYFGLVIPVLGVIADATGRDAEAIAASVFGEEPAIEAVGEVQLASILGDLSARAPEANPFALTVHGAGTERQFVEIHASYPQRMIYSENYRYDSAGTYLDKAGFSDGEVGKQIVYSMYYLHFGHFGGWAVKLIYGLLGLALTVISVTGVNIWLAKRRHRDALNDLWAGIVWGVPVALFVSATSQVALGFISPVLFWSVLALCVVWSLKRQDPVGVRRGLLLSWAAVIAALLTIHLFRFGTDAVGPAALAVNLGLILQLALVAYLLRGRPTESELPFGADKDEVLEAQANP